MLNIITGRSAKLKSKYLLDELAKGVEADRRAYLIVPRQFTFESDRTKLLYLGNKIGNKITVLSFDRIYESLTREYGKPVGERLTDSGIQLLMISALKECRDKLSLFKNYTENENFINNMISFSKNLKRQSLMPEDIMAVSYNMQDGTLKIKLYEFALIMQTFDRMVSERYVNPDDDLKRTAKMLSEHHMFEGATVAFDGFSDFSQAEYHVAEQILKSAHDTFLSLCCDNIYEDDESSKFSESAKTGRDFLSLAKKCGVKIAKPQILDGQDSLSDEICLLDRNFLNGQKEQSNTPTQDINIYEARDIYDECDFCASTIKKLVRTQNYRYSDITVITRDIEEYGNILYSTFEKYQIPVFYDSRKPLFLQPLTQAILSVLHIVTSKFKSDDIFEYLKCGLSPFDRLEIDECEKYVFVWGIDGFDDWNKEWTGNVRGYDGRNSEAEAEKLKFINDFREKFLSHIKSFALALCEAKSASDIVKQIYKFIEQGKIKEMLAKSFDEEKDVEKASLIPAVYDKIIELLDLMSATFKEGEITLSEFERYFELLCKTATLANIPQTLDEVQIGEAGKIRPVSPKIVFVLGANYQSFPLETTGGELFSLREEEQLANLGIPQGFTPIQSISKEHFIAYTALSIAERMLYVSYKTVDSSGEKSVPSLIVGEILEIFPAVTMTSYKDFSLLDIESENSAVCEFARLYNKNPDDAATLKSALNDGDTAEQIVLMNGQFKGSLSAESARKLYKGNLRLSPSRAEVFFHCPFSYFCANGLRVRKVEPAKIDYRQRGSIIHYLLEQLLKNDGVDKLFEMNEQERYERITYYFNEYSQDINAYIDQSNRFKFNMEAIKKDTAEILNFVISELKQSDFRPVGYEMTIGDDGDVKPLELKLSDGSTLSIIGQADRVDVADINGERYLRVVDYKTGKKEFYVEDVFYGLNMQMLIYLFTISQNGDENTKDAIPAGILYLPTKIDRSKYESNEQKSTKMRMQGLVLANPDVILGMDKEGNGQFITQRTTGKGKVHARSKVTPTDGFKILQDKIIENLVGMGERIKSGDIAVTPLDGIEKTACKYCDFKNVCRIENGGEIAKVEKGNNWLKNRLDEEGVDDNG